MVGSCKILMKVASSNTCWQDVVCGELHSNSLSCLALGSWAGLICPDQSKPLHGGGNPSGDYPLPSVSPQALPSLARSSVHPSVRSGSCHRFQPRGRPSALVSPMFISKACSLNKSGQNLNEIMPKSHLLLTTWAQQHATHKQSYVFLQTSTCLCCTIMQLCNYKYSLSVTLMIWVVQFPLFSVFSHQ